ncbi:hypothetical protein [Janibacter sp. HTCC2649]|uniref:hypothetical protein n=1 Tax=Janibacter sp. HTCC2649 TaxID=313589 RepID=UPI0011D1CB34|nr:hypothetical protein [Janibacter sp. HTCC2649]
MKDTNRRSFIVGAGGTAAAAVVTSAALAAPAQAASTTETGGVPEKLVAWVDDPQTGRLTLMLGEDEVTVHNPDLVRRLTRAARG